MSNLLRFRFEYGFTPTPEQIAAMQPYVKERIDPEEKWAYYHGDIAAVLRAVPDARLSVESGDVPATTWIALMQRLDRLERTPATVVNERCSVHVPGLGLMLIDEVTVEADLCTEHLQRLLDEGWRIIAVCVQPDQRRPDYILGRTRGKEAAHA